LTTTKTCRYTPPPVGGEAFEPPLQTNTGTANIYSLFKKEVIEQ